MATASCGSDSDVEIGFAETESEMIVSKSKDEGGDQVLAEESHAAASRSEGGRIEHSEDLDAKEELITEKADGLSRETTESNSGGGVVLNSNDYDVGCIDRSLGSDITDQLFHDQPPRSPTQSEMKAIEDCGIRRSDRSADGEEQGEPSDKGEQSDVAEERRDNEGTGPRPRLRQEDFDFKCVNDRLGETVTDELFYEGRDPSEVEARILDECAPGGGPDGDGGDSMKRGEAVVQMDDPDLVQGALLSVQFSESPIRESGSALCEEMVDNDCMEVVWENVGEIRAGAFTSIQFSISDPDVVYAGVDSNDMSLYKSEDGGRSWRLIHVTGHTSGVSVSPSDPNIVMYSVLEGPVQRTADGGDKWFPVLGNRGSVAPEVNLFTTISFAPSDGTVAYTATVEGDHRSGSEDGAVDVYVSNNGGLEWALAGTCPNCGGIKTIAVAPDDSQVMWAATNSGPRVSRDGGRTWGSNLVSSPDSRYVYGIAIKPDNPAIILAASTENGMLRSEDGGQTWALANQGLTSKQLHTVRFALGNPNVAYVATHDGVYRSGDAGQSWEHRSTGLEQLFVTPLAIHPENPDIVLAGTASEVYTTHPAHFNAGMHSGEGLYMTSDGGLSWTRSDLGIHEPKIAQMATHPLMPFHIWADGESGRGAFFSADGGYNWDFSPGLATHYPMVFAFSPLRPNVVLLTSWQNDGELMISDNWGHTWTDITHAIEAGISDRTKSLGLFDPSKRRWFHLHGLAIAPSNPDVIYVGSVHDNVYFPSVEFNLRGAHIFKSEDGGKTFAEVSNGFPIESPTSVNAIVVDPFDADVAYAMTSLHEAETAIGIYKTVDGGSSWNPINEGLDLHTNDLQIDPIQPETLYAATESGVYKTIDGGMSWQRSSNGLPSETPTIDLALDSQNPMYLYVITPDSVFRTKNGGEDWYPINRGIVPAIRDAGASSAQDKLAEKLKLDVTQTGHSMYGGTFAQDRTLEIDPTGAILYVVAKSRAYDDWRAIRHVYRAVVKDMTLLEYEFELNGKLLQVQSSSSIHNVQYHKGRDQIRLMATGLSGTKSRVTISNVEDVLGRPITRITLNGEDPVDEIFDESGQSIVLQIDHSKAVSIAID